MGEIPTSLVWLGCSLGINAVVVHFYFEFELLNQGAAVFLHSLPMKSRKGFAHDVYFCHTCQGCSWPHNHILPDTEWQLSVLCSGDFQTLIFNKLDHKLSVETLLGIWLICLSY